MNNSLSNPTAKSGGFARLLWLLLALTLLLPGCAGYRMGPSNGMIAGSKSIQVNPFINNTIEMRLADPVTAAIRKKLQQDGTYALNTGGTGDVIVNGVITQFYRSELSFKSTDVTTVRDYYLFMVCHITAVDRETGKVLVDRNVTGRTTIQVGNDLASGERQAVPVMAEDLARNAVSALVDGKW